MSLPQDEQTLFNNIDQRITNKTDNRSVTRATVSQSMKDIVNLLSPDNIVIISDTEEVYIPSILIVNFVNQGDSGIEYKLSSDGITLLLLEGGRYGFAFTGDPAQVPLLTFISSSFYAFYPDGEDQSDVIYLTSTAAAAYIAAFNLAFAQNFITQNGNGNVNILVKNLLVNVANTIAASITSLQILDSSDNVVYHATTPIDITNGLKYAGHDLGVDTYKVVVQSSDPTVQISVKGGNSSSAVIKDEQFAANDPDNGFTSPIQITINKITS